MLTTGDGCIMLIHNAWGLEQTGGLCCLCFYILFTSSRLAPYISLLFCHKCLFWTHWQCVCPRGKRQKKLKINQTAPVGVDYEFPSSPPFIQIIHPSAGIAGVACFCTQTPQINNILPHLVCQHEACRLSGWGMCADRFSGIQMMAFQLERHSNVWEQEATRFKTPSYAAAS